jgi:hypothetical protein
MKGKIRAGNLFSFLVGNFDAKQYDFHNVAHHSVSRKSGLAKEKKDKKKKDTVSEKEEKVKRGREEGEENTMVMLPVSL